MAGWLGGIMSGFGKAAQEQNLLNSQIQAHANEETAKVMEHLSEQARDEKTRNDLLTRAAKIRIGGGKKPGKGLGLDDAIRTQIEQQYQLGNQAPPQGQAGGQQGQGQLSAATVPQSSPSLPAPPTNSSQSSAAAGLGSSPADAITSPPAPIDQAMSQAQPVDPLQDSASLPGPSMRMGPTNAFEDPNGAFFAPPHVDAAALQSQGPPPPQTPLPTAPQPPPPAQPRQSGAAARTGRPAPSASLTPPSGQPNMPGGGYSDAGTPNAVAGGAPPSTGYGPAMLGGGPPSASIPIAVGAFPGSGGDQQGVYQAMGRDHKMHWYRSGLLTPDEEAGRHAKYTGWEDDAKYKSFNHWQVEGKKELDAYHQEQSKAQIEQLKADGVWDKLTPVQQAQVKMGDKITAASSRLQAPHKLAGVVQGKDIAGETDIFGHPVDPAGSYRAEQNLGDNTFRFVPTQPMTTGVNTIDDSGNFTRSMVDRNGRTVGTVKNVVPPAGMATSTTSKSGIQMVQQPDGSIKPVNVHSTSTTSKSLPGRGASLAAPPSSAGPIPSSAPKLSGQQSSPSSQRSSAPGKALSSGGASASMPGQAVGGKSFNPKEVIDQNTQVGQLDNTINLVQNVQKQLPLLTSAVTAKKIQMQMDPKTGFIEAMINRRVPLTPQEAKLAADMQSLAEHINTLRGPLGATGFRGADAFANLLAQGGSAMQNPRVTANVLNTTLRALNTQRGIKATVLQQHNQLLQPPPQNGGQASQYTQTATGPGGHKIGFDGKRWVDTVTGQAVQ